MLIPVNDKSTKAKILDILTSNNLPVNDLSDETQLFGWLEKEIIAGTAGLELYGKEALVRSISLAPDLHHKGLGARLYNALEKFARGQGVQNLYLLTTTAAGFFSKQGFEEINRDAVATTIRNSIQFKSTCPASATVMKKKLTP